MPPRWSSLSWAVLLALTAALADRATASAANKNRPDVVLITIDTLRADHLRCYGYDRVETPALDSLAQEGVRFSHAFTPSPITNPSHASILTGLIPSRHGVTDFATELAPTHATLAQLLKKEGYRTAAFIGAVSLDSRVLAPGFDRGFDFYDNFPRQSRTKSRWGRLERRALDVVYRAEQWLNGHRAGPRFVWIHLYDPHDPYEPPPPYSEIYRDHLYDGEIAYADFALDHLFAFLKSHGWYESSLIVVVGDHGEGLGEHGEVTHGIFLYDSTTHVPLILKASGRGTLGGVVNTQVRTVDIVPTVLDLLVVTSPGRLDGESLKPLLERPGSNGRAAYGETDYPLSFGWAPLRSVRVDGLKFIEAPRPELYDLVADPGELTNLYEPWNPNVVRFRAMLAGLSLPAAASPAAATSTIEELQTLGYLGASAAAGPHNESGRPILPDPKDKVEEQNLLHRAMLLTANHQLSVARAALLRVLELNPGSRPALALLSELETQSRGDTKAAD